MSSDLSGRSHSVAADREDARLLAFQLVLDVQAAVPGAAEAIDGLVDDAQCQDWPEVALAALFAAAVAATTLGTEPRLGAIDRLLERAEADGDAVMVALALAMRSERPTTELDAAIAVDADADLARATVLLESSEGDPLERMTAYNACAEAYCDRWLWELGDDQYEAAMSLVPPESPGWLKFVLPAIVYNRAEMQVDWASALCQLGDADGVRLRWQTWEAAMAVAETVEIPDYWRTELNAMAALLGAIVGRDTAEAARAQLASVSPDDHPAAWPEGHLHLAIALSDKQAGRLSSAAEAAETAIERIDPSGSPDTYDLALSVAAELETSDRCSAGLRYARRQLGLRSTNRLASLGSMQSRVQAERLRGEHDLLSRHAHLDDLTGLSNRRGLERYLAAIERQGVESVALLLADLDDFKTVNDRYGHAAGDAVLIAVARVLETSVRQGDCAVRLGGDEFALVLGSVDPSIARLRAAVVMESVSQLNWLEVAPGFRVSLSVGLAAGPPSSMRELIARADSALYEAKAAGGFRIIGDGAEPAS